MIRLATRFDVPQIWALREETKALLKDRGIDQWQHSNPSYETFLKDIDQEELYVYVEGAIVLGMIAIKKGIEKTYNTIYDGTWGFDLPYLTVHRLAVKRHLLGLNIGKDLMMFAEKIALNNHLSYMRIDTHEKNRYAIRLFESIGYIKRGWIMLENDLGDLKRLAFDKEIEPKKRIVYLDTWTMKPKDYQGLIKKYQELKFITDPNKAKDAEIIISMPGFIKEEHLKAFPNLKWIQLLTAGYDAADVSYVLNEGIRISYAKDVFSIQIAEDTISKMLYFNRHIGVYHDQMKEGLWKFQKATHEIYGSTVGIIGAGSIGLEIAKRLKPFEVKLLGYRRSKKKMPFFDKVYHDQDGLNQLISKSDYIIIAVPLTKDTKHMISYEAFSMMKKGAVLINVARGDIIDQEALVDALEKKRIRGAAIDVTSPEPLPKDHPLWKLENVFITPHIASTSPYVHKRLMNEVDRALSRYLTHQPLENEIIK